MSLLEVQLGLDTPLFSGSWRPDRIDTITPLRPSTIKGIWRWWARSYAAGALFDKGLINESLTHGDVDRIARLVGSEIGLGYADPKGRESKVSSYVLELEAQSEIRPSKATRNNDLGLQRIKLLTLNTDIEYIDRASFRLSIQLRSGENLSTERQEAALGSLLTSLVLSGFGKGSRRGLGCLNLKIVGGDMAERYSWLTSTNADHVKRLVDETREAFAELIKDSGNAREEFPPLPLISDRKIDIESGLRAFQLYSLSASSSGMLKDIHNFFVRAKRQQILGSDDLRSKLAGWVLGLPREQRRREQRRTGYIIGEDINRRASPFILSVHGDRTGYLSIFVSRDWPREIKWRGAGQEREIQVTNQLVISAFKIAKSSFENYCEKLHIRHQAIWP